MFLSRTYIGVLFGSSDMVNAEIAKIIPIFWFLSRLLRLQESPQLGFMQQKKLRHSLDRPSRSNFVQLKFSKSLISLFHQFFRCHLIIFLNKSKDHFFHLFRNIQNIINTCRLWLFDHLLDHT